MIGEIVMKKLMILIILLATAISCELFDAEYWDRVDRRREERGHECYQDYKGNYFCKDTK